MIQRRGFITLLGGAAAWPLAVQAQQRALPVIGYLSGRTADADASTLVSVRRGLADVGYAEGRNVAIESRFADGRYDRLSAQLTDLQRKVGVIVFVGAFPTEELLEQAGLLAFRHTPAGKLDFGRQKTLDLARALACRPRILLLDEPAAGLRNREIKALDDLIVDLCRRRGLTIVLVEHVMQLVMAVADDITVLNFGQKIAAGKPAEIRSNPVVVGAYLGDGEDA